MLTSWFFLRLQINIKILNITVSSTAGFVEFLDFFGNLRQKNKLDQMFSSFYKFWGQNQRCYRLKTKLDTLHCWIYRLNRKQKQKTLPSLAIIQQQKHHMAGQEVRSQDEQVTGRTRNKTQSEGSGRSSFISTPDRFHVSDVVV